MRITCCAPGPVKVVTAEQMRELDRRATEEFGIPSLLLMENAGRAVSECVVELLDGDVRRKSVLVVAGPGNNGGDGFVAARYLHNAGAEVTVAFYGDRASAKGDALTNIEIAEKMGIKIEHNRLDREFWSRGYLVDAVVDALLGTGAKGRLRPPFAEVIGYLDDFEMVSKAKMIAADLPSGVNADDGSFAKPFRVDATVTFALPKVGLLSYPAAALIGKLIVADIGIPRKALHDNDSRTFLLRDICWEASQRKQDSHKGDFGHVAIVAGSVGMTGAATLAAMGALRIGTGLVTCLVPESLNDIMEVKLTEAMTIPVHQGNARAFGLASLDKVLEYANKWDAAVIGPGFGRDEDTIEFALELIKRLEKPAIIDADALYAVSRDLSVLKKCKAQLVITPHPGEMATLLGTTVEEVQSNRLEVARSFAKQHGVTVVLKGAGTVIAEPDGTAYINTTGSPGMATGGTGDVLSGMIGGLLAQRNEPEAAAKAAVYLHGLAGEIAAKRQGEASMIASDVADSIGAAIQEVCNLLQRSDPPLAHER